MSKLYGNNCCDISVWTKLLEARQTSKHQLLRHGARR